MIRPAQPLRAAVSALLTAGALAFGASAALAKPAIPACNDPYAAGSCATKTDCQRICDAKRPGLLAFCNNYCCSCLDLGEIQ
jgi:hypothetical protein